MGPPRVPGKGLMEVSAGSVSANNWIAVGREGGLGVLNVRGTGTVTKTGGGGIIIIIGSIGGTGTANVIGGRHASDQRRRRYSSR